MKNRYTTPSHLPEILPIKPIKGSLLLPRCLLPLSISKTDDIDMINDALSGARLIGIVQPKNNEGDLYDIGCVGRITSFTEADDNQIIIALTGICRFFIQEEIYSQSSYREVYIDYNNFSYDLLEDYGKDLVNREELLEVLEQFLEANNLQGDWDNIQNFSNEDLVNSLSIMSPHSVVEKQALLEAETLTSRANMLIAMTEMKLKNMSNKRELLQ